MWMERQRSVIVSQPGEAVCKNHPCAAHRRDVASVFDIAADIREIHQQSRTRVFYGLFELANLEGDNRFDAGRQRRIAGREWIVKVKITFLVLGRESMSEKEHHQEYVDL